MNAEPEAEHGADWLSRQLDDYVDDCNQRRWDAVKARTHPSLHVNGAPTSAETHADCMAAIVARHPDITWRVAHRVSQGDWQALLLVTESTSGAEVLLAHVRFERERVVEVWASGPSATEA